LIRGETQLLVSHENDLNLSGLPVIVDSNISAEVPNEIGSIEASDLTSGHED
jgi:hypothetical protein